MIINHNISALNTYRQLGINQNAASKAMEKLSSGLRINRAGDDAAGLAISEKMRAQVRGLDQASRNAQDGISMIQTAEGALQETHNILQRMRELATQAANDTNVEVDRNEIQKEINQLSSEINRIGNTTEFNTQSLLKGDGRKNIEGLGIDLDLVATKTAGTDATTQEIKVTIDLENSLADNDTLAVNINGREFTITYKNSGGEAGDVITSSANTAQIDLGGSANTVDDDAVTAATKELLQNFIDSDDTLKGNFKVSVATGVITIEALKDGEFAGSKGNITLTAGTGVNMQQNTSGTMQAATSGITYLGKNTDATAASMSIDLEGIDFSDLSNLVDKGLTINGQQIQFYNADKGTYNGEAIGINISDVTDEASLVDAIVTQANGKLEGVTLSRETGTNNLVVTSNEKGASSKVDVTDGGIQKDFRASFQVGANQGQSMTINIADMRSNALNITGTKAGEAHSDVEGAKFTAVANVTDGTDNKNVEYALDVSTHESASAAIKVINNAIERVSAQRSDLGAFQNRLEHTIANLNNASENLTAAESRIRDVDMAKEVMEMTRANILGQASQAMLAQANQKPQAVLQLLQ